MQKNQIKIGILAALSVWIVCFPKPETAISAEQPDFKIIIGEWIRPDGVILFVFGMSILTVRLMRGILIPVKSISWKPMFPCGRDL